MSKLEYYLEKGRKFYEDKKYDIALEYYLRASELDPNSDTINNMVGVVYSYLDEYENAVKYFLKAHELNPEESQYLKNIVQDIYVEPSNKDKVIKYGEKLLNKNALDNDKDHFLIESIAKAYFFDKQYLKAIELFERIVSLDLPPEMLNYEPLNFLGWAYTEINYELSTKYFHKSLEVMDSNYSALIGLAEDYIDLKQYDESIKYFEHAESMYDLTEVDYNDYGFVLIKNYYEKKYQDEDRQDFLQKAIEKFLKAEKVEKSFTGFYPNIAEAYFLSNQPEKGLDYIYKIYGTDIKKNNQRCYILAADYLKSQNKKTDAKKMLERSKNHLIEFDLIDKYIDEKL